MDPAREAIIQSLQRQMEMQITVRSRHLTWADRADNSEIAQFHVEMADLLSQVVNQYNHLLDKYNQPPDVGTAI